MPVPVQHEMPPNDHDLLPIATQTAQARRRYHENRVSSDGDSDVESIDGGVPITLADTLDDPAADLDTQKRCMHEDTSSQKVAAILKPGSGHPTHAPGPIAPPSQSQQRKVQNHDPSGWKAAAEKLPDEFASEVEAAGRRQLAAGPSIPPREDRVKETFKKTSATQAKLGAPRRFERTEYTVHDAQGSKPAGVVYRARPPS